MFNRTRKATAALLATVLMGVLMASTAPADAHPQARSRRVTARPRTPYAQGYQRGYSNGYLAGQADWKRGAPRDFQHSGLFQQGDQQATGAASAPGKYRDGYDLGFELGYTDGYYGRARNVSLPPNAEQERANLARAASI